MGNGYGKNCSNWSLLLFVNQTTLFFKVALVSSRTRVGRSRVRLSYTGALIVSPPSLEVLYISFKMHISNLLIAQGSYISLDSCYINSFKCLGHVVV